MRKSFGRFLIVGSIGFLVDATIFTLILQVAASPHFARLAAFVIAVCVTFGLNRRYTFADRDNGSLWRYGVVQSIGAGINMAVFSTIIWHPVFLPWQYYVGLTAGSIAAMFFNFFMSHRYAFRQLADS